MKRFLANFLKIAAFGFCFAVAGCSGTTGDSADSSIHVESVSLNKQSAEVEVGKTLQLYATVAPATATNSAVIWTSSDPSIAQVSATGLVTANSSETGTATITVTTVDGNKTAQCNITVKSKALDPVYGSFYNYPIGRRDSTGTLTITNNVALEVLCFVESVKPENYIGTIEANDSMKVKLPTEKFYTIIAVCKPTYEESPTEASQTSALAYYSNLQAYKISVSPDNLTGSGKWYINNPTKYWVSLESTDNSKTFAVVQPESYSIMIPIKRDTNYNYKIVYRKELKYQDRILAVSEMTNRSSNDTALADSSNNFRFTTDIPRDASGNSLTNNLAPSIYITNQSGKTIQLYNGQKLLDNGGNAEDFAMTTGRSEMLTGLSAGGTTSGLVLRNPAGAWDAQNCPEDIEFKNGKVYKILITKNTDASTSESKPVIWSVTEENASAYYDE